MKKFALILAIAAMGCASAAITLPTSKAELKSALAAKKAAAKAENDARKEAAKKALTDKVNETKATVAEAQTKVDAAKQTATDAKTRLDALKDAPASTPTVEIEKPGIEATEAGLIIKKPSLKIK